MIKTQLVQKFIRINKFSHLVIQAKIRCVFDKEFLAWFLVSEGFMSLKSVIFDPNFYLKVHQSYKNQTSCSWIGLDFRGLPVETDVRKSWSYLKVSFMACVTWNVMFCVGWVIAAFIFLLNCNLCKYLPHFDWKSLWEPFLTILCWKKYIWYCFKTKLLFIN